MIRQQSQDGGPRGAGPRTRLAVISDAVEPFHTGGKEARYAAILPRLLAHDIDVDVYTMNWWHDRRRVHQHEGLAMHALCPALPLYSGSRRSIRQAVVFALASLRLLFRRFDVVEADAIPFVQLFPLAAMARLRRRPFLVTWHEVWGRDYWVEYLGPLGRVAAWLEGRAARLPDLIIATSQDTGDRVRALRPPGSADAVIVVPPGLSRAEVDAVRPDPEVGEILSVGRLLPNKNVHLVIEALAVLHERGRPVRLTVVGRGPELPRLTSLVAERGLQGAVDFREHVADRADLLALMAGARVLAFPSVREGFGMVALEALACGLPVVTSDHEDNYARRLVTDGVTGRTCPATSSSLAEALAEVMDRHDEMSPKAREAVADHDWDHLAAQVAGAVRRLHRERLGARGGTS